MSFAANCFLSVNIEKTETLERKHQLFKAEKPQEKYSSKFMGLPMWFKRLNRK